MSIVHLLTSQKDSSYNSGCGLSEMSKTGMPSDFSGWSSDITCPKCATRLWVTHGMTKIIDLDDPAVAKKFHFTGKPFGFRWLIGSQLVYIYESPEELSPACAIPISNFVPECLHRPCEYSDAQTTAREWVIKHGDGRVVSTSTSKKKPPVRSRARKPAPPPKPFVPADYTGELCAKCGKIDEGDFVPNPNNMLEQVCMVCLLKK